MTLPRSLAFGILILMLPVMALHFPVSSTTISEDPQQGTDVSAVPRFDAAPELAEKEWITFFEDDASLGHYLSTSNYRIVFPSLRALVTNYEPEAIASNGMNSIYSVGYRKYFLPDVIESSVASVDCEGFATPDDLDDVDTMNGTGLYGLGYAGAGLKIGVMDTGIDHTHRDFAGKLLNSVSVANTTYGYISDCNDPWDLNGHGTHVASIALGNSPIDDEKGVAYDAQLLVVNIASDTDRGYSTDLGSIAAIEWMMEQEADIINYSYGGGDSPGLDPLELAFKLAIDSGIFAVTSGGNNGPDEYTIGSPCPDGLVNVASVDDGGAIPLISSFSCRAPTVDGKLKPDIAAPGSDIRAADATGNTGGGPTEYTTKSGTSQASAQIAGAAAVLISALNDHGLDWNPGTIKAAMMRSGVPVFDCGYAEVGAGLLDMGTAYDELIRAPIGDGNVPQLMYVSAPVLPIDSIVKKVIPGFEKTFYPMIVSSHPTSITTTLSGENTEYVTVEDSWTDSSRSVAVTLDLPSDYEDTSSLFKVEFDDGVTACNVTVSVEVIHPDILIGMDAMHSDGWAPLVHGGSALKSIYEWGMSDSIGFIEIREGTITPSLLDQFDIWWAPDSNDMYWPDSDDSLPPEVFAPYTVAETAALKTWVDAGGSFLMNIDGKYSYTIENLGTFIGGTHIEGVNEFLSTFGLQAADEYFTYEANSDDLIPELARPAYDMDHILLDGVAAVDHLGGYFSSVSGNTRPFLSLNGEPVAAAYECGNGGRAVFLHSSSMVDETGFVNMYNGGTSNRVFVEKMFDWLLATDLLDAQYTVAAGLLSINATAYTQGAANATTAVTGNYTTIRADGTVEQADLTLSTEGASHTATLPVATEGNYKIELQADAVAASRYAHVLDESAPEITTTVSDDDVFESGDRLEFEVSEWLSGVAYVNLTMNGVSKTLLEVQGSPGNYYYPINTFFDSGGDKAILFSAIDCAGNSAEVTASVVFNFGTTSTTSTSSETSTSTTTGDDDGDGEDTPGFGLLFGLVSMTAAAVAVRLIRKRE